MSFDLTPHDAFFADPAMVMDAPLCRNWSQGDQNALACTFQSPLRAWSYSILTPNVKKYLTALRKRWDDRVSGRDLMDPLLDFTDTNSLGLSLPDAEHCCIRPLADAYVLFGDKNDDALQCGMLALKILNAYLRLADKNHPEKPYSYLLNGAVGPYGWTGRVRKAGWILNSLEDALRIVNVGPLKNKTLSDFTLTLIGTHVGIIAKNWPLVHQPQGDHLPCLHIPTFNLGILGAGAFGVNEVVMGVLGKPPIPELTQLGMTCCDLIEQFGFTGTGNGFWYDIPYVDGKFTTTNLPEEIASHMTLQTSAGATHVFCANALTKKAKIDGVVPPALQWQRDKAVAAGWTKLQHPIPLIKQFGDWTGT